MCMMAGVTELSLCGRKRRKWQGAKNDGRSINEMANRHDALVGAGHNVHNVQPVAPARGGQGMWESSGRPEGCSSSYFFALVWISFVFLQILLL
jgi:hypothetical protein